MIVSLMTELGCLGSAAGFRSSALPVGWKEPGSFPDIDETVQREFLALREYLTRIEAPANGGNDVPVGATIVMPSTDADCQKRTWWIVLQGIQRLPAVALVRERLSRMPGCVAAQVVSLSSTEIRLSVTTTCQVDQHQLEFVLANCRDVPKARVMARTLRPVR